MFRSLLHVSVTHVVEICKTYCYKNYFTSVHFTVTIILLHIQLNAQNIHHARLMNFPHILRFILIFLAWPYGSVLVLPSVFVTTRTCKVTVFCIFIFLF